MPLNHLFDIGTRYRGNLVLAIADEKPDFKVRGMAYLLDLETKSVVGKFPVRYERPGFRLALSWDDQICCIGCYEAYGLAGYSALSGQEVWRRKDLKSVQGVVCSEVEDWVFCARENGAPHLVKASTGETLEKLTGLKRSIRVPLTSPSWWPDAAWSCTGPSAPNWRNSRAAQRP